MFRQFSLAAMLMAGTFAVQASVHDAAAPRVDIWLEDLVAAEPLAAADQEALAAYLSELAFASPQGTVASPQGLVELPASLAADRQPRMIFLSLSDGVERARILRAAGRGVAATVEALRAELEPLVENGFAIRFVRVDLVTEVERSLVDPDQELTRPRSLYGLALERETGLAFLAGEVVVDTLINSDQKLRFRNLKRRPEAAAVKARLGRLSKADEIELFRFTTASTFHDGQHAVPLFRGHRRFAELDPEQLLAHAVLAGDYLVRAVADSGRFAYSYLPKTDEVKDKYNALRHCGTTYAMLELYEVTGDQELLAAAERALGYLERELIDRCTVAGVETACVVEDGEVKLGGNALAMVALAKHAEVTGSGRHLELIDELGRFILLTQSSDGEFLIHKQSHPQGEVSDFVSGYYPGEALLALVRRPEPDPAWLDAAERGARWLINVRDRDLPITALNHDHWLLYALNELHRLRPDPLFLEHAARIVEAILERQRQREARYPDWLGSYYTPPRSTPTATRSEGLGAAYFMLRDAGRSDEATRILAAIKLGVAFQLQTQMLPENVLYLDDPARALGGFHRSLTNYEIRIDYVQHNISALLLLRRILLERGDGINADGRALNPLGSRDAASRAARIVRAAADGR